MPVNKFARTWNTVCCSGACTSYFPTSSDYLEKQLVLEEVLGCAWSTELLNERSCFSPHLSDLEGHLK